MTKAFLFNIQKFCVHDGPGIRTTVFFKGCPLSCGWCHNPESQKFDRELLFQREKCRSCGQCQSHCPQGAAAAHGCIAGKCTVCGLCADLCPGGARMVAGKEYCLEELLAEIEKDAPFYEQSGGGVTLSGGEALCQIDFVARLVRACSQKGIHVAIDTCGQLPFESFASRHKQHTGRDNSLILANLARLSASGAKVQLRLPLIEGINADDANIAGMMAVAKPLGITAVALLPYHDIGRDKYRRLGREYPAPLAASPSTGRLEEIRRLFAQDGFAVTMGG